MAENKEKGYWRTIKGRKVFFPEGQDPQEVIKKAFNSNENPKTDKMSKELGLSASNGPKFKPTKSSWNSINSKINEMAEKKMPAGTYNLKGELIDRYGQLGYQVSPSRLEMTSVLSETEISELLDVINEYLGNKETEIGFWTDGGEPSHYSNDEEKALYVAKLFNQFSILDWESSTKEKGKEIKNPFYDGKRKLTKEDYLMGKQKLEEELR